MSRRLTPWFPASTKPARIGVYEVDVGRHLWWRFWDGKNWRNGATTAEKAARSESILLSYWKAPWRGLARKP